MNVTRGASALILAALVAGGLAAAAPAAAAPCSDVDVVFARDTGEPAGLGSVGRPFAQAVASGLPGLTVSSYAVAYAANSSQTSAGPGATDMSAHIASVAAACPGTRFVIGGYSQGATVTSIAVGIRAGSTSGTPIRSDLAPRISAVVAFGNPLGARGRTIASESPTYGPKSRDYCVTGDPVCGGGNSFAAHLAYNSSGSTAQGAAFATQLVHAGGGTGGGGTTSPPAATCVRASNSAHIAAGRATARFGYAFAVGSGDSLGRDSRFVSTSLSQAAAGSWSRVASC